MVTARNSGKVSHLYPLTVDFIEAGQCIAFQLAVKMQCMWSKPVNLFDPVQRAQAGMGVREGTAADTGFKFSVLVTGSQAWSQSECGLDGISPGARKQSRGEIQK